MTPPTTPPGSAQTTAELDALPWPSLLALGTTTLLMVTTEMLPTAVLTPMSHGLGVSEAHIAHLVSWWAATVVLVSFPLVRLTRRFRRRDVISVSMLTLAGSTALTAVAESYAAALGVRMLGAAAVGLLWASVNAHVADLVSDRLLGPAVAVVLGGATLGMVVGTPLVRLINDLVGWRTAFATIALAGLITAALVRALVASAGPGMDGPAASSSTPKRSLVPMLTTTSLAGAVLAGHYGAYTFITRLTESSAVLLPGAMSAMLLAFGVASAAGVAIAGWVGDRTTFALPLGAALTAGSLLALATEGQPVVSFLLILVWGAASGALPPLAQTMIFRLAGPEHRSTAGATIPVVFNGGIAVGAGLAAQLVAQHGVAALPVPAAAVIGAAAVGLACIVWAAHHSVPRP